MPRLVSLQKPRLVTNAVEVGQMRPPPVLHITATTATSTAKPRASSVPATTLLHAVTPRERRHHGGRRARNTFVEHFVERSVDRCMGTTARPTPSSSVLTKTAVVSRAFARIHSPRHPLFLALLSRVYAVVARSVEGTTGRAVHGRAVHGRAVHGRAVHGRAVHRRAVHGPRRTVARPRSTVVVATGRAMGGAVRPPHPSSVARRTTFPGPTSCPAR